MRTTYLLLEIARRLAARWFRSRLYMTAPSVFLLFRWWWRSQLAAWVLPFFDLQGGIEETVMLMLIFLGFFVCVFSVFFFGSMYFLSLCFAGFLPSVLLCFLSPSWGCLCSAFIEPVAASVVVTAAPPKCSVTNAFNEENVRGGCQQTKRLCLYWQSRGRVKRRWTVVAKRPCFAGCEFGPCNSSNFAIKPLVKI